MKLLDFGLAKQIADSDETATIEGLVIGRAAYMSPEQADGKPLDVRSDIFSFGAVLYELSKRTAGVSRRELALHCGGRFEQGAHTVGCALGAATDYHRCLVWEATTFTKNRERLLDGDVAREFWAEIVKQAREKGWASDEHFTVDGTLIEAWASLKSFQRKGSEQSHSAG